MTFAARLRAGDDITDNHPPPTKTIPATPGSGTGSNRIDRYRARPAVNDDPCPKVICL